MANIQTRRSISFSAADFEIAQRIADRLNVPVAKLASQALRDLAARDPASVKITQPRAVADQVVIDDLRPDSPFRVACQLAGCGAVPGQACRPVPRVEGGSDPELLEQRAHQNRLWQVVGIPPMPSVGSPVSGPLAQASQDLARNLQSDLDARVGVLPHGAAKPSPWSVHASRPGSAFIEVEIPETALEDLRTDHLPIRILRGPLPETWAEIGKPLDPIAGDAVASFEFRHDDDRRRDDAEAAHPDAGEVQVVYDDGAARRPRAPKRKGR